MEKQNRYIYHYCAAQGNATVSGIAQLTFRIVSQEDLNTLKEIVSDDLSFQAVAIVSLSYLGRENAEIVRPTPAADLADLLSRVVATGALTSPEHEVIEAECCSILRKIEEANK